MKHDFFISYSRKDLSVVEYVYQRLRALDYDVWVDLKGIESGDPAFKQTIVRAIKQSRLFIFFSSIASNQSPWTAKEIGIACKNGIPILPIKLDDSPYNDSVSLDLVNVDYVDWSSLDNRQTKIESLLKDLQRRFPIERDETRIVLDPPQKKNEISGNFISLEEYLYKNQRRPLTIARRLLVSALSSFIAFAAIVLAINGRIEWEFYGTGMMTMLILLCLVILCFYLIFFVWKPEIINKKRLNRISDIESVSRGIRIVRGKNGLFGLFHFTGSRFKKIVGIQYLSIVRLSASAFILQNDAKKYGIYSARTKTMTPFVYDAYSVDNGMALMQEGDKTTPFSLHGFRKSI